MAGIYNETKGQWMELPEGKEPLQAHFDMGFVKMDSEPQESIDAKAQAQAQAELAVAKGAILSELHSIEQALVRPLLDSEYDAGIEIVEKRKARRKELQDALQNLG